jgi:threonine dehydrogenase-like Zn-dependent dehydrogenase
MIRPCAGMAGTTSVAIPFRIPPSRIHVTRSSKSPCARSAAQTFTFMTDSCLGWSADVLGHEFMGEVVELGAENKKLKAGDRVVVPFTIICGECDQCQCELLCLRANESQQAEVIASVVRYTTLRGNFSRTAVLTRPRACGLD